MSGKVGWPLGRPRSEETRQKMREHMRKRWQDPAYRERQALVLKRTQPRAASAGGIAAAVATKTRLTAEQRRYFEKVRNILGAEAAREALGLGQ